MPNKISVMDKKAQSVLLTDDEKTKLLAAKVNLNGWANLARTSGINYFNLRNAVRIGSTSEATAKEIRAFLKSKKANQVLKPETV